MEKKPPAEIEALVRTALGAFNDKNLALFSRTFHREVVIIDGFAPFRWTGPDAQERWWTDAETWAKDLAVVGERISPKETVHWQVAGSHAYVVISATLTITLSKGEPINRSGMLTYVLVKVGEEWKAEVQAWARLN